MTTRLFDLKLGGEGSGVWCGLYEEGSSHEHPKAGDEEGGGGDGEYDKPGAFFFDPLYFLIEVIFGEGLKVHIIIDVIV